MSLQTPEGLGRSVENLTRLIQQLVGDVEKAKADLAELKARYNAHNHTVTTTATTNAAAGDSSATVTVAAATVSTPK